MTPPLEILRRLSGNWTGISKLWLSPAEPARESPSDALVTVVGGGRFVRLDYTWSFDGKAQEGSLLFGFETKQALLTAVWLDTWHNGERIMPCEGSGEEDGCCVVRGFYPAPTGPDWGWWIRVVPGDARRFSLIMENVTPAGERQLAVESAYERV
jgi:hypothetical protein